MKLIGSFLYALIQKEMGPGTDIPRLISGVKQYVVLVWSGEEIRSGKISLSTL